MKNALRVLIVALMTSLVFSGAGLAQEKKGEEKKATPATPASPAMEKKAEKSTDKTADKSTDTKGKAKAKAKAKGKTKNGDKTAEEKKTDSMEKKTK